MALDLIPRRLLSFPNMPISSFWDDEDWFGTSNTNSTGLSVYEDDKNVYVEVPVVGIDPKDVEVTFEDGYVWVRGQTKDESEDKNRKYYRKSSRSFSYRVAVPGDVDSNEEPTASYKHGVMKVSFTKSKKATPKRIEVKNEED